MAGDERGTTTNTAQDPGLGPGPGRDFKKNIYPLFAIKDTLLLVTPE